MEEKQLMFEMDSSHRTELEKILRKYNSVYPQKWNIGWHDSMSRELLEYLEKNKNNPSLPKFNIIDLKDLPLVATRLVELFGYQTKILENPYLSNNRTVLIWSCFGDLSNSVIKNYLVTLQDIKEEYAKWENYKITQAKDFENCKISKAFPTETQFISIFGYHIKNVLKRPNGINQYTNCNRNIYLFKTMASFYLYKKMEREYNDEGLQLSLGEQESHWTHIINLFQIGEFNSTTQALNGNFVYHKLPPTQYLNGDKMDEVVNKLSQKDGTIQNSLKLLLGKLFDYDINAVKNFIELIGKIMLGNQFISELQPKAPHLTIIQSQKPGFVSKWIQDIFDNLNILWSGYQKSFDNLSIGQFTIINLGCSYCELTRTDRSEIWKNEENFIDFSIQEQLNNRIFDISLEPKALPEFAKQLFKGETMSWKNAYTVSAAKLIYKGQYNVQSEDSSITGDGEKIKLQEKITSENIPNENIKIESMPKEETKLKPKAIEISLQISPPLQYTSNLQHIIVTTGLPKFISQLLEENPKKITHIRINNSSSEEMKPFYQNGEMTSAIIAGKLAMMSMVYMINKLCLGIDVFDAVDQSTSSIYQEGKAESDYINEFYADCIKDFTGDLDPEKIIKETESILKRENKSYDKIDWRNTERVATKVREQDELKDLLTVTSSDLLAAYENWKALKKIDLPEPDWIKFSENLLNHLSVMQNQELLKFKEIFLCRKSTSKYTQHKTNTFKQPTGMIGIQIDNAWYEKLTNKEAIQAAQEKEKYEKVLSLLEAQFDDAMKEIQSFKIPPQPYMP